MIKKNILGGFLVGVYLTVFAESQMYQVLEKIPVQPVWSAVPVGFAFETVGNYQFVVFYDANRQMVAGQRELDSRTWTFQKLPSFLGWDSHNFIVMALDQEGYIHISGNMHVHPLVYFRSERPYDVTSLSGKLPMVGKQEDRVTYPKFLTGPSGELVFTYRNGSSGNGDQIYNVYDVETKTWKRLLDRPLSDGEGKMNAYFQGPQSGPDGYFHMTWIWRDDGGCEFNHDLCYARSKDLVHWETADGSSVELPIRYGTPGVKVDPVPVKGGLLNGNGKIGFDSQNRAVLAYHKFDETGKTQLYNARFENGAWKIFQTSEWDYRWFFSGGGCIEFEIKINSVVCENGELTQTFFHKKEGSGMFVLDEQTLKPLDVRSVRTWPSGFSDVRSDFPEMRVRTQQDAASQHDAGQYVLRWEVLPVYRDQRRPKPWPESAMLEVYKVR